MTSYYITGKYIVTFADTLKFLGPNYLRNEVFTITSVKVHYKHCLAFKHLVPRSHQTRRFTNMHFYVFINVTCLSKLCCILYVFCVAVVLMSWVCWCYCYQR